MRLLALVLLALGAGAASTAVAQATRRPQPAHLLIGDDVTLFFEPDDTDFPNPERGFHGNTENRDMYGRVVSEGHTLVRRYVRLDDYRASALPQAFLDELGTDLEALREHGLKVILRFSYNFGPAPDAPLSVVMGHIGQLEPVISENADVIAVLQAGFIGAWGEWHTSTNDLLELAAREEILGGLLGMLPESRMIQIRTPRRIRDILDATPDASTAFSGTPVARVGQVNDCFLSNDTDAGTYLLPGDREYVEVVSKYTAMGGETCDVGGVSARNDARTALHEMELYHYDYLNYDYWKPIIAAWAREGALDEISERLGYRYVMLDGNASTVAGAGERYDLELRVRNEGFGKLYNPRPLLLVLRAEETGERWFLQVADDARTVLPLGGETVTVRLAVDLPASLPPGRYGVSVSLPDASERLASDARYSVRFANAGVWDQNSGTNALQYDLEVR